jgi:3-phenylpropionate/trans-cinnamate dioxygenase ferredoxin subunit
MTRHVVATVDELPPGQRKIVEIAGRSIGVFNVGGEYFALRNRCPHQGGPLCLGQLAGAVSSSGPGMYTYSRHGEMLRCPWHGWEFDIRTGQSWFDPAGVRVRRYDVTIEDEVRQGNAPLEPGQVLVQGPYVAETYPTSIEQRRVVVELP